MSRYPQDGNGPEPDSRGPKPPPMNNSSDPSSLTPLDLARDLAQAHMVERIADGELRPDELPLAQREIAQNPAAESRIRFERMLRTHCARVMSDIPVDPTARHRVLEAAKLRLRGEADALEGRSDAIPFPQEAAASAEPEDEKRFSIGRGISFGRVAAAAALVFAGFLTAHLTGESNLSRAFSDHGAAAVGIDLSSKALRDEYYAKSVVDAGEFLGASITLPSGEGITPSRYDPSESEPDRPSVSFQYAVRVPDPSRPGKFLLPSASVLIQRNPEFSFAQGRVFEKDQGVVYWRVKQDGNLLYHIQSDSAEAVRKLSEALNWPAPSPASADEGR